MNILHIISSLSSGGAEIYVRDLSMEMARSGHKVCIAYISEAAALGRDRVFEDRYKKDLERAGIGYAEIGHAARRQLWKGGKALRAIAADFRPDVIHAHLYFGLFHALFARLDVPVIYTHHNHRLGKGRFLYPLFNRVVDRYVGISRECADVMKSAGAHDVSIIYNGINPERLEVKDSYSSGNERLTVLSAGRLDKQKNQRLLIDSFELLYRNNPGLRQRVRLLIAGEGPLRDRLAEQIARRGLQEHVLFLGNRSDMATLLHDADLFVLSSDYEGLPISLLEAIMTGVPAVVTDVGSCRSVVESCRAGIVVPPRDAAKLADAVAFMVGNGKARKEFGENGRLNGIQYSIHDAARQHLALYAECLPKRTPAEQYHE